MRSLVWVTLALAFGLSSCKSKEEAPPPAPSATEAPAAATAAASSKGAQAVGVLVKTIPAPPDVAAPPADAEKTESGLASKVLTKGTGTDHPRVQDRVRVHYTGWTKNGEMFDSSVSRGNPA